MHVPRATLATVALAAVASLCGCSGSEPLVAKGNSQALYVEAFDVGPRLSIRDSLFEYRPGEEHASANRDVQYPDQLLTMDRLGDLYFFQDKGLDRYAARSWQRDRLEGTVDAFALNDRGDLFVAHRGVRYYAPGSTRAASSSTAYQGPVQDAAADLRGHIYLAPMNTARILVFADIHATTARVIRTPRSLRSLSVDNDGRIWAISSKTATIYEYATPASSPIIVTAGLINPDTIVFDHASHAYVLDAADADAPSHLVEFTFGALKPMRTLAIYHASRPAFDDRGDVYVTGIILRRLWFQPRTALFVYGPTGLDPVRRYPGKVQKVFFGPPTST